MMWFWIVYLARARLDRQYKPCFCSFHAWDFPLHSETMRTPKVLQSRISITPMNVGNTGMKRRKVMYYLAVDDIGDKNGMNGFSGNNCTPLLCTAIPSLTWRACTYTQIGVHTLQLAVRAELERPQHDCLVIAASSMKLSIRKRTSPEPIANTA